MEVTRSRSIVMNSHSRPCYGGTKVENHCHELLEKVMLWNNEVEKDRHELSQQTLLWRY